jgi:hypothetical protein
MNRLCLFAAAMLVSGAAAGQPAPGKPICDTPEHRQFDFWVGRWDVYRTDTNQLVAHSLIEKLYGGWAVRENWMPIGGTGGGSLNSWRPSEKRWRQTWTDSGNNWNEYAGGLDGSKMVLTGSSATAAGGAIRVRITYEPKADGSVVQSGYQKSGASADWSLSYQFAYRRAASSSQ